MRRSATGWSFWAKDEDGLWCLCKPFIASTVLMHMYSMFEWMKMKWHVLISSLLTLRLYHKGANRLSLCTRTRVIFLTLLMLKRWSIKVHSVHVMCPPFSTLPEGGGVYINIYTIQLCHFSVVLITSHATWVTDWNIFFFDKLEFSIVSLDTSSYLSSGF